MRNSKLLIKSILIPTLGISAIGTIAAVCTSCGNEVHVTRVELNKTSTTLAVGKTEILTANVLPKNATNKDVTWTSSNTDVATVNSNGTITAKGAGTATITSTSVDNPNAEATCEVTVDTIHVTSVTLDKTSTTLAVGDTEQLTATVLPETATDQSVTWTSSNPSVATVKDGVITAVGLGNATITVTTNDGGKTATCEVNVNTIHVESVILNKASITLAVGGTETLTATVLPADATDKSVTWSSSITNVATVNDGTITAKGLGHTTITVKTNDGGKTATCGVNVVDTIHVENVELNKHSIDLIEGQTETLTATVLPETATDKSVTWSSSNNSVATVDSNGTITAKKLGETTITVTSVDNPNAKATCEVVVAIPYVVIAANMNSTLTLRNNGGNNPNLQYSTDGTNWTTYSAPINIARGQNLYLKGNNPNGWSHSNTVYSTLSITGDVSIAGNVMGLLDNGAKPGEQGDISGIPCDYCFYSLFDSSTGITSVSKNFLPATTLTDSCYESMFYNCSSLTTAPALPATTLKNSCYFDMFEDCSSLTAAPTLPATTLINGCYSSMFYGCTVLTTAPELPATTLADTCYGFMFGKCSSLTTAPELPATTLADNCYSRMFEDCSSLTIAPELPATTLANDCYNSMFDGCTSLTTAPDLPATTLAETCYANMFQGCSSLNSIKIGYINTYDSNFFSNWVYGVASSGTFYYNGRQTAQDFGFPSGWTTNSAKLIKILANANSTLTLRNNGGNNPNLQYSTDGANWSPYSTTININQGEELYLKGNNPNGWSSSLHVYSTLFITGDVSISGDVIGLLNNGARSREEGDITDIPCNYCFYELFESSHGITSVSKNFLPATDLKSNCYYGMFSGCSSLTTVPDLPATTLVESCYAFMFSDCTSLTTAPELPATTLANNCYNCMFYGCSSLTSAPALPAITLASDCYRSMFENCVSLTTAPELPATTLTWECYYFMFSDCSSLNSIKIGYTGNYIQDYFYGWASGVASSGTFYYNGSQNAQYFQLPSGWTTQHFN